MLLFYANWSFVLKVDAFFIETAMEEIIYKLPFDLYGTEIIITFFIVALVLFSIVLRLLKVPQRLMVIITGALAMVIYMSFQVEGPGPYQPLVNLAQRQKQLDQQLGSNALNLGSVTLTNVKIRLHTITLTLKNNEPVADIADEQDVEKYAETYFSHYRDQYCKMLTLEQNLPYRKTNQQYFDMTIKHFYIKFIVDGKTANVEIPITDCADRNNKT